MRYAGTVKIHFTSARRAIAASVDGSATAGVRSPSGKIRTWVAHVEKATPTETAAEAAARVAAGGPKRS